ncbi:MAG: hypothetical protein C4297_00605 [Gemmataceae bacterium]
MIRVQTGSRLHFGLIAPFGGPRRFGGVGMMVAEPGLSITLELAHHTTIQADPFLVPLVQQVLELVQSRLATGARSASAQLPAYRITVLAAPRVHTGLGVGTQLALALARGILRSLGIVHVTPADLAAWTRRGTRSAIGTYGFFLGGLIADAGKATDEPLAPLLERLAVPEHWRILLVLPLHSQGLTTEQEEQAFEHMHLDADSRRQQERHSRKMSDLLTQSLLPALRTGDFAAFADSLTRYNRLAGEPFAPLQKGVYHAHSRMWIEALTKAGVQGVGQSSWGPTVFGLFPDPDAACWSVARIASSLPRALQAGWRLSIASPLNSGAALFGPPEVSACTPGEPTPS